MKPQKLSVLLGIRERVETVFKNAIDDLFQKFKNKQTLFRGERKTYIPFDGYADEPTKRSFTNVASTVQEQLDWLSESSKDFLNVVFSIEATNASGTPRAELILDGTPVGVFSSLELLRLKSILEGKLRDLYKELPVRSEQVIWVLAEEIAFKERGIQQSPLEKGNSKTTIKESYILQDPHPDKNRQPVVGEKSTQVNIGEYTAQYFSGEFTIYQRAHMLVKYEKLLQAVITALEHANNVEVVESQLGQVIFDYLHK
ncbi:hypothetical protein AD998_20725 [bacterium 336/3]|jgi:hypothetical protein|nr:hypothetical protein AD998_20725 [bacterium 336/3]